MKIIELRGENVKRMKAFALKPDEHTVIVSGRNGQGKSSLLDSIVLALGGKSTEIAKLTKKPIRDGEDSAFVEVDLGEYIVRRTWSEKGDSLEITGSDGVKFSSPQKMLDELIGDLSFDPLAFTRLSPKEQRAILLSLVDIGIDLDAWQKNYDEVYEKRTEIGREVKRLKGAADSIDGAWDKGTPNEEVSIVNVLTARSEAEKFNNMLDLGISEIEKKSKQVELCEQKIVELKQEIEAAKADMNGLVVSLSDKEKKDLSTFDFEIENAEEINKKVRQKKQFQEVEKELIVMQQKYEKGSEYLLEQEESKAKALSEAKMPVSGLSFNEDGITFKGIPFAQLSQAEQIKVSMAIAMAQNPKLRIIRIDDGSLLDEDNMKAVSAMAEAQDFQVWVERVDSSGKVGVVIEDGTIISS